MKKMKIEQAPNQLIHTRHSKATHSRGSSVLVLVASRDGRPTPIIRYYPDPSLGSTERHDAAVRHLLEKYGVTSGKLYRSAVTDGFIYLPFNLDKPLPDLA